MAGSSRRFGRGGWVDALQQVVDLALEKSERVRLGARRRAGCRARRLQPLAGRLEKLLRLVGVALGKEDASLVVHAELFRTAHVGVFQLAKCLQRAFGVALG